MSGGYFDYNQYSIKEIIETIQEELDRQGKKRPEEELYGSETFYETYPEEKFYPKYSEEVQEKMQEAIKQLTIAQIYTERVDYFLSGDDDEEDFIQRLCEELDTDDPESNGCDCGQMCCSICHG